MSKILTPRDARQVADDLDHLSEVRRLFKSHETLRGLLREVDAFTHTDAVIRIFGKERTMIRPAVDRLPGDLRQRVEAALKEGGR